MKIVNALTVPATGNHTVEFTGLVSALTYRISDAAGYGTLSDINGVLYVQSNRDGKRHTVHDKMRLVDLAELCSMNNESAIKLTQTSSFSGASPEVLSSGVGTLAEFKINITGDGRGYELQEGEKWVLELTGLTAGDTLNVWAHESPEPTLMPVTYSIATTSTFPNQRFKVGGNDRLAIKKDGSLDSIEILDGKRQVKKQLEELSAEIRNGYGQCYVIDTLLGAGGSVTATQSLNEGIYNYLIPCTDLDEIQVNATAGATIQLVFMKW